MSRKHSKEPVIPDFIDLIVKERMEEKALQRQKEDKFWEEYCEETKSHPMYRRKTRG